MKTTILFWGRAEGKTTRMIRMLGNFPRDENILVLTHNQEEAKRLIMLDLMFQDANRDVTVKSYNSELVDLKPTIIAIDNIEFMKQKTFNEVILPLRPKEMIITGSHEDVFKIMLGIKDKPMRS